jgi:hypothetical protein
MTSAKLPFNSEADTFTKYQSSGKIKHNGDYHAAIAGRGRNAEYHPDHTSNE